MTGKSEGGSRCPERARPHSDLAAELSGGNLTFLLRTQASPSPRTPMMKNRLILAFLFLALTAAGSASPLRILYAGTPDRAPRMACHALMRDLGRDAIWFEYVSDPAAATADFVGKFDAVVLDADGVTIEIEMCPVCRIGHLVPYVGADDETFEGCSRFPACNGKVDSGSSGRSD